MKQYLQMLQHVSRDPDMMKIQACQAWDLLFALVSLGSDLSSWKSLLRSTWQGIDDHCGVSEVRFS